jgi:hypothetical protein
MPYSSPQQRKPTERQLEIERREHEEWLERQARAERHAQLLTDGYVLVKPHEREHPAHSEELLTRIDALAATLGRAIMSHRQATRGNANGHVACGQRDTVTTKRCSASRDGGERTRKTSTRLFFRLMHLR